MTQVNETIQKLTANYYNNGQLLSSTILSEKKVEYVTFRFSEKTYENAGTFFVLNIWICDALVFSNSDKDRVFMVRQGKEIYESYMKFFNQKKTSDQHKYDEIVSDNAVYDHYNN